MLVPDRPPWRSGSAALCPRSMAYGRTSISKSFRSSPPRRSAACDESARSRLRGAGLRPSPRTTVRVRIRRRSSPATTGPVPGLWARPTVSVDRAYSSSHCPPAHSIRTASSAREPGPTRLVGLSSLSVPRLPRFTPGHRASGRGARRNSAADAGHRVCTGRGPPFSSRNISLETAAGVGTAGCDRAVGTRW